jgi:hypothetical protein
LLRGALAKCARLIEWLCTQDRLNPEVAIIFGTAVRYRRAIVSEDMKVRIQIIQCFTRGLFVPTLAL